MVSRIVRGASNDFVSFNHGDGASTRHPVEQISRESRIVKMLMVAHDLRPTRLQSASLYPQQSGKVLSTQSMLSYLDT
jgi:hypothetical protein